MTTEQIGLFILDERKRQGLSQKALAAKAGLTRYQQILEIEKNQFDYGIDVLVKVLNALGVKIVLTGSSQFVQTSTPAPSFIFDFSKAKPATEEALPVEKKKQVVKKPTAVFKRSQK